MFPQAAVAAAGMAEVDDGVDDVRLVEADLEGERFGPKPTISTSHRHHHAENGFGTRLEQLGHEHKSHSIPKKARVYRVSKNTKKVCGNNSRCENHIPKI
jgi:hypothetical protein